MMRFACFGFALRRSFFLLAIATPISLFASCVSVDVMSFTGLHCGSLESVAECIRTANPDFVGVQDADWRTARAKGIDEPEELSRLTGLNATFARSSFFEGGQRGVLLLSRQKPMTVLKTVLSQVPSRILLLCEYSDCWVGVTRLLDLEEKDCDAVMGVIRQAVSEAAKTKPVFLAGSWDAVEVPAVSVRIGEFMNVLSSENGIGHVAVDQSHACGLFAQNVTGKVGEHEMVGEMPLLASISMGIVPLASPSLVPIPATVKLDRAIRFERTAEVTEKICHFEQKESIPEEGYEVRVAATGIYVRASSDAGRFYALQTLRQLAVERAGKLAFPCGEICDAPRFAWRGVHLDESRHFFGKAAVKRLVDMMAYHKLNVFHWHLTDSEGWRIQVAKRPKLVEEGAKRPYSSNQKDLADRFEEGVYGPFFYTESDIQEIVRYADERHVRIVPEVDFPGHSRAALNAYPELRCFPKESPLAPKGVVDNVLCLGNDASLDLVDDVFDAVCDLFPGSVIHIGGDEVNKINWRSCPKCQARIHELGLSDEKALQSWFMKRVSGRLAERNRRVIGWDEMVLEGVAPVNSIVMSWRGTDGGIVAAKSGLQAVMAPHISCYFDYDQCLKSDPATYPWFTRRLPIADAYAYDPLTDMPKELSSSIIGGQCCNWSEYTCSETELQWKMWPRTCATAEALWSPASIRNFAGFKRRMLVHRERLVGFKVNCAPLE